MLTETFLRDAPLYKPAKQKKPDQIIEFAKTRPKLHCETCSDEQTFILQSVTRLSTERRPGVESRPSAAAFVHQGEPYALRFTCAACGRFTFHVTVLFLPTPDRVQKIGQFPAPSV